jgi:hypothetical protein
MPSTEELADVVLFEVLPSDVDSLLERLHAERLVWVHFRDGSQFVAASLRSEASDLAALLRTVERWATERGLSGISFEVDGRSYLLRLQPYLLVAK